jgi:hypothetical protein
MRRSFSTATLTLLTLVTLYAMPGAAEPPDGQSPGGRRGPPPEALEACSNQADNTACSFAGRRGEDVTGTCLVPPRQEAELVCVPEHHQQRGHPGGERDGDVQAQSPD